jgi:hypothetical protein
VQTQAPRGANTPTNLTNTNLNEMFDMADEDLSLRHFSSPIDEITEIFDALEQYWKELERKGSFHDFVNSTDRSSLPAADESQSAFRLRAAFMANIVAQAAMYSLRQGSVQDAWEHTADAKYHLGLVHGPGVGQPKDAARFMAKLRHRESDDCKRMVVTHYLEHRNTYRSKDAAAEEMARSLVPYPFRTVRDWLKGI